MYNLHRKRTLFRYVGDFSEQDLESPCKRKMFWNSYQVMRQKNYKQINCLRQKNSRLQKQVHTLKNLVADLQSKNKTNVTGESC